MNEPLVLNGLLVFSMLTLPELDPILAYVVPDVGFGIVVVELLEEVVKLAVPLPKF
jgi:hypothetical protein